MLIITSKAKKQIAQKKQTLPDVGVQAVQTLCHLLARVIHDHLPPLVIIRACGVDGGAGDVAVRGVVALHQGDVLNGGHICNAHQGGNIFTFNQG